MTFTSLVPTNRGSNIPLIDYLVSRFTYFDRSKWQDAITCGKLSIDGTPASTISQVNGGQSVVYDAGEFDEPPANLSYTIIYEDEWFFVVNKPGNLLIHRAGRSFTHNLMYQLRNVHEPVFPEARCVHRLDRNTSGAVLIAKSSEVQAKLSDQFINHQIDKTYIALVEGQSQHFPDTISQPIGSDPDKSGGCKFRIDINGKEAITRIVASQPVGSMFSLLTLKPVTGRTHQLRVHCASISHPIFGDRTYGSTHSFEKLIEISDSTKDIPPVQERHALHCSQLDFYHPWLFREYSIKADIPEDMRQIITAPTTEITQ